MYPLFRFRFLESVIACKLELKVGRADSILGLYQFEKSKIIEDYAALYLICCLLSCRDTTGRGYGRRESGSWCNQVSLPCERFGESKQ